MSTTPWRLGRVFGIEIRIDPGWPVLGFLLTFSLALGYFPLTYPKLPRMTGWGLGLAAALLVLSSILLRDVVQALVSTRLGVPRRRVTLVSFGGVAPVEEVPRSVLAELVTAIAGPAASLAVAVAALAVGEAVAAAKAPLAVQALATVATSANLLLAAFALLPAYPFDGGRILRALLWAWDGDLERATKVASAVGYVAGAALALIGVAGMWRGGFASGVWWLLAGGYLFEAARAANRQRRLQRALVGETVRSFARAPCTALPPEALAEESVDASLPADRALVRLQRAEAAELRVVDGGKCVGTVVIEDLLRFARRPVPASWESSRK